jgi:hypothetical protein
MRVAVHRVESVADQVDALQRQIASRAEELHDTRSGHGQPLDDWPAAERQLIWRPAMEVQQRDGSYVVKAQSPDSNRARSTSAWRPPTC